MIIILIIFVDNEETKFKEEVEIQYLINFQNSFFFKQIIIY